VRGRSTWGASTCWSTVVSKGRYRGHKEWKERGQRGGGTPEGKGFLLTTRKTSKYFHPRGRRRGKNKRGEKICMRRGDLGDVWESVANAKGVL